MQTLEQMETKELDLQEQLNYYKGKVAQIKKALQQTEEETDAKLFRDGCLASIRTLKFTSMDFLYLLVACLGYNRNETISLCSNSDSFPPNPELEAILVSECGISAYKKIRKKMDSIYADAYKRLRHSERASAQKDVDMKEQTNARLKRKSKKFKRTLSDEEMQNLGMDT